MTVLVIGGVVSRPEVGTNNVQILKTSLVSVLVIMFFSDNFFTFTSYICTQMFVFVTFYTGINILFTFATKIQNHTF